MGAVRRVPINAGVDSLGHPSRMPALAPLSQNITTHEKCEIRTEGAGQVSQIDSALAICVSCVKHQGVSDASDSTSQRAGFRDEEATRIGIADTGDRRRAVGQQRSDGWPQEQGQPRLQVGRWTRRLLRIGRLTGWIGRLDGRIGWLDGRIRLRIGRMLRLERRVGRVDGVDGVIWFVRIVRVGWGSAAGRFGTVGDVHP